MTRYEELTDVVRRTGIWDNGREKSHGFVVSGNVYELATTDKTLLDGLACATDACMLGVSRIMAIAANSGLYGRSQGYIAVNRLLGRSNLYGLGGADTRPNNMPLLRKVDLVPDAAGHMWIAEIDATNPRSLGYSLIGRALCQAVRPDAPMLGGVVPFIAQALQRQKASEVTFLYGHTQRFYAPEFHILAKALAGHGIGMVVVDEEEIEIVDDWPVIRRTGERLPRWFMDLPPMNVNKPLIDWLVTATRQRTVEFLVPPKYFLGSKAMLALLSNPLADPAVEHLLLSQIEPRDLEFVRRHIPPTVVVGGDLLNGSALSAVGAPAVLKRVVASGMKGVWFADDSEYMAQLGRAMASPGGHVLQREVTPGAFPWHGFAPGKGTTRQQDWYLRLTAYFSYRGVEDIAVTACRDKRVHGGPDAILTGTVLV